MKILNQNKYFFGQAVFLSALALIGIMAAISVQASSIIIEPDVVTATVGETFDLPVTIDPEGEWQYTAGLVARFSSDLVEVVSFSFDRSWLIVPQPGYDSINNNLGELIKTGGIKNGFVQPVQFGTIALRAKKAGDGQIYVDSQSFILDAGNSNTLSSGTRVLITVVERPVLTPSEEAPVLTPPEVPAAPSVEALPNLPAAGKNIFDFSLSPGENPSQFSFLLFLLILLIAIIIGIISRNAIEWYRRRRLTQKIKNDEKIKK